LKVFTDTYIILNISKAVKFRDFIQLFLLLSLSIMRLTVSETVTPFGAKLQLTIYVVLPIFFSVSILGSFALRVSATDSPPIKKTHFMVKLISRRQLGRR